MLPIRLSKSLTAASANAIALSQSLASAGNLTLNGASASGGVATLDTQRRVLVTSAGNDSGITFTVTGASESGTPISQTLTGANAGTAVTTLDFLTVTQVSVSGATASTVTVGTNTVGSTPWKMQAWELASQNLQFSTTVSGTINYSIEVTPDDFYTPGLTVVPAAFPTSTAGAV